jgi:hypothetical protein
MSLYSLIPKKMNKKVICIIPIMLLLLSILALSQNDDWAPNPPPDDGDNPPDNPTYTTYLQITEIRTDIDGNRNTITSNNDKISDEAGPESDVDFKITVKNTFNEVLKNIDGTVTIKDIDDGDNLEENDNLNTLDPGDSGDMDFSFTLPLKVDDGNYDVDIHIEARDEDNSKHTLDWTLELEVRKEKHNIQIRKATISPNILECNYDAQVSLQIVNLGTEDETINIEVTSPQLGLEYNQNYIDLTTGADEEAQYDTSFNIHLPNTIGKGTYPINIKVLYYDDRFAKTKDLNLQVKDCTGAAQITTPLQAVTEEPAITQLPTTQSQPQAKIAYISNESLLLILTIFFILILGLVIFLIGAVIIQLRR